MRHIFLLPAAEWTKGDLRDWILSKAFIGDHKLANNELAVLCVSRVFHLAHQRGPWNCRPMARRVALHHRNRQRIRYAVSIWDSDQLIWRPCVIYDARQNETSHCHTPAPSSTDGIPSNKRYNEGRQKTTVWYSSQKETICFGMVKL